MAKWVGHSNRQFAIGPAAAGLADTAALRPARGSVTRSRDAGKGWGVLLSHVDRQTDRRRTDGSSYQPPMVCLADLLRLVRWTQPRPGKVESQGQVRCPHGAG